MKNYECCVIRDGMTEEEIAAGLDRALVYLDLRTPPISKTPEQIQMIVSNRTSVRGNVYVKAEF